MYISWINLAKATDEALHGCNWLDCRVVCISFKNKELVDFFFS